MTSQGQDWIRTPEYCCCCSRSLCNLQPPPFGRPATWDLSLSLQWCCCRCCQSQSVDSLRAENNLRHPLVFFCQKISSKAILAMYLFCMSLASGRTKSRHGLVRHDGNAMPGATAVPSFHHLVSVSWYAYLHILLMYNSIILLLCIFASLKYVPFYACSYKCSHKC